MRVADRFDRCDRESLILWVANAPKTSYPYVSKPLVASLVIVYIYNI